MESTASKRECDMMTGTNPIPRTVPEFLTEQPMHFRDNTHDKSVQDDSLDTTLPVPEIQNPSTLPDPNTRLADVLLGMNKKSSTQTLMVRPVSRTTLTFDGKSKKMQRSKISSTYGKNYSQT